MAENWPELRLRPFLRSDYAAYASWYVDPLLNRFLGPMDDAWLDATLTEPQDHRTLVALSGGALVAVIGWCGPDAQHRERVIIELADNPAYRRHGLAVATHPLSVTLPPQQPVEILAISDLLVTAAVTDGGEAVAGFQASRDGRRTCLDDTLPGIANSTTVELRVPEEPAQVFTTIAGQATAVVASAAALHLQLPLTAPWLDRWLAVPGHPACALRLHLSTRRVFDHDDTVVHIERSGAMQLALRQVRLLDDQGQLLVRDGGGSGGGMAATYPVDIDLVGTHPLLVLDGALFVSHATRTVALRLTQVPIAVPSLPNPAAAPEQLPAQVLVLTPVAAGLVPPTPVAATRDPGRLLARRDSRLTRGPGSEPVHGPPCRWARTQGVSGCTSRPLARLCSVASGTRPIDPGRRAAHRPGPRVA